MSAMKRRFESNERFEKVVKKQELLMRKFSSIDLESQNRKGTPPIASFQKKFMSTKILPKKSTVPS